MNNAKKELCRLCLKIIRDENFVIVGKITLEILNALSIEMDLSIDEKSLICTDCQDSSKRCFNFKSVCISSENIIAKYITEGSKLDLKDLYLKTQNRRRSVPIPRGHEICRLCMKTSGTTKYMNSTDELIALINDILHKCIPEVNINAVNNPVICETCLLELQSYSEFHTGCLDVEKKINRYCEATGVAKRQVQLYNVLQFIINESKECYINDYDVPRDTIKLDDDKSNIEFNCKELNTIEFHIKTEEIVLKSEKDIDSYSNKSINCNSETELIDGDQVHFPGAEQCNLHKDVNCDRNRNDVGTEVKPETLSLPTMVKEENVDSNQLELFTKHNGNERSTENIMERSVIVHDIKNEEIEIKSEDVDMSENTAATPQLDMPKYECPKCSFKTKFRGSLTRHSINHQNSAEVTTYECDICPYKSKIKFDLKRHLLLHHQTVHTKSFGITKKYECDNCLYTAKHKGDINKHMLVHKNPSEVTMYRCTTCTFATKHQRSLRSHTIVHKKSAKIRNINQMPKCDLCSHEGTGSHLKCHLSHKSLSEITLLECDKCIYRTIRKGNLKTHMKIHKDPAEVRTFKCDFCSYETIELSNLKRHMSKHQSSNIKSLSEAILLECYTCSYKSKYKRALVQHMKIHKDRSELTVYKCHNCDFESKYKKSLRRHMIIHCRVSVGL